MAKKSDTDKAAKAGGKKGKGEAGGQLTSLRSHPVAGPAIRRAKATGGLLGFLLAAVIGFENGTPFADAMLHALEVGMGANLAVWAGAVMIWKRILISQAAGVARSLREAAEGTAE